MMGLIEEDLINEQLMNEGQGAVKEHKVLFSAKLY